MVPAPPWQTVTPVVVGGVPLVKTTSSVEFEQGLLLIVHLKVALDPAAIPVTPEVGEEGVVIFADPLTTLHVPVPVPGELPARVKFPLLQFA
jgi:hypothetical protein